MATELHREHFTTSRECEYFTEKELRAQIGHEKSKWPLAILRELIDNSLDGCEMAGVTPEINIEIKDDQITVSDNGHGIPAEIIKKSMDYLVRVSDKAYYVSPTRGAMGNALKVIWAAPFVTSGSSVIEVITRGEKHCIKVGLDLIAGKPSIEHSREPFVKNDTFIKIEWPESSGLLLPESGDSYNETAYDLIEAFHAFNPHATFSLNDRTCSPTAATWKKWNPGMPTSAHWYTAETLRNLIAAYIAHSRNGGREKTIREFVSEFRGLSSTGKQKAVTAGWSGAYLHDFVVDGDVDNDFVTKLLKKMQDTSVAPKPAVLGMVGKDHFIAFMEAHGVSPDSVRYACKKGDDGLPYILETAFGVYEDDHKRRSIVAGLNWSPVIGGDPDPTIRRLIQEARLDPHDPVILMIHIARPRFDFMDRGKTRIAL
jgi:DNA topoisomerase VI subunit B